eukprot:Skav211087  [mRNA]  locus=scaffold2002:161067:162758:+ [translate_table: standard]
MQELEDQVQAQAGGQEDAWRKTLSIRKHRSKSFLTHQFAAFSILLVLAFHYYLGKLGTIGFGLHDADRQDIADKTSTQKQDQKRKRRLRYKGAQLFEFLHDGEGDQGYSFLHFFGATLDAINIFWKLLTEPQTYARSLFAIVEMFWPQGHLRCDLHTRISGDVLKTVAALKWRIILRAKRAPYNLLQLGEDTCPQELAQTRMDTFLTTPSCCLDPWWAQPVLQHVESQDEYSLQVECLKKHVQAFRSNARGVSSREETQHAAQRTLAAGWKASPPMFERQCAEMILRNSWEYFASRSKGAQRGAPEAVRAASKIVRKRKILHPRPNQLGSPMFAWIAHRRKAGCTDTVAELRAQWKNLAQGVKETWARKHRLAVATRRFVNKQVSQSAALEERDSSNRTPWGVGDSRYPLDPQHVANFLEPFRKRETGMGELERLASISVEAADFRQKVHDGTKYHSIEAAVLSAKASFGSPITDKNACCGTWGKVLECAKAGKVCMDIHPGVCKTADKAMLPAISALASALPHKDGMVLMLELAGRPARDRAYTFVRVVVGQILWEVGRGLV